MKKKNIILESYMTDEEWESRFDEYLNEIFPNFKIFESTFNPCDILKKCDPIAYHVYFVDWKNELEEDEQYDDEELDSQLKECDNTSKENEEAEKIISDEADSDEIEDEDQRIINARVNKIWESRQKQKNSKKTI